MAGTLQLTKIKFHAGLKPGKPSLEIKPGAVVVFVGPNNSGKSLALREIENWCIGQNIPRKVVNAIEIDFPNDSRTAEKLIRQFEITTPANEVANPDLISIGQHSFRQDERVRNFQISLKQLEGYVNHKDLNILRQWLISFYTIRLDGRTRFSLADPQQTGDLLQYPQNHLWALFKNDNAREYVRNLTEEAFGLSFVIDPTAMQQFRIRMSPKPPSSKSEEQGLDETTRAFHSQAYLIRDLSDGVQAFVGLVSAVMSLPHKIILLDEPDAFLHPPLARRLGSNLARISRDREASLVVATHSPDYLIGSLESVADTSVVRLTYDSGVATARFLPSSDLSAMMRDPLLRTTDVLRALFHRTAIITESDSDRAFYDEVNRRLLSVNRGIRDSLFLNAQNKQTIHRLVAPLRQVGIPAVAIVDLDILKEGGKVWEDLLDSCQVPQHLRPPLEQERAYLARIFNLAVTAGKPEAIKYLGLAALSVTDKTRAETLLNELSKYGLFIVSVGELERWLPNLGVNGHGSDWVVNIFTAMGQSEPDPGYVNAGKDDVWQFLDTINSWANDSARLGVD